jgi:hypothetical protein
MPVDPRSGSGCQVFEVLEDMRPIASADRDHACQQSPIQIDVVPIGLQIHAFIDEAAADEGTDVVVHIAEIEFRMLATVYRDLQQASAKAIIFHPLCELMANEIHQFANARILQHAEYCDEAAELIARAQMAELRQRSIADAVITTNVPIAAAVLQASSVMLDGDV